MLSTPQGRDRQGRFVGGSENKASIKELERRGSCSLWGKLPVSGMLAVRDEPPSTRLVYTAVAALLHGGQAPLAISLISELAGVGERQTREHLKRLEEAGHIIRLRQKYGPLVYALANHCATASDASDRLPLCTPGGLKPPGSVGGLRPPTVKEVKKELRSPQTSSSAQPSSKPEKDRGTDSSYAQENPDQPLGQRDRALAKAELAHRGIEGEVSSLSPGQALCMASDAKKRLEKLKAEALSSLEHQAHEESGNAEVESVRDKPEGLSGTWLDLMSAVKEKNRVAGLLLEQTAPREGQSGCLEIAVPDGFTASQLAKKPLEELLGQSVKIVVGLSDREATIERVRSRVDPDEVDPVDAERLALKKLGIEHLPEVGPSDLVERYGDRAADVLELAIAVGKGSGRLVRQAFGEWNRLEARDIAEMASRYKARMAGKDPVLHPAGWCRWYVGQAEKARH